MLAMSDKQNSVGGLGFDPAGGISINRTIEIAVAAVNAG
jgi:hypothetical protein